MARKLKSYLALAGLLGAAFMVPDLARAEPSDGAAVMGGVDIEAELQIAVRALAYRDESGPEYGYRDDDTTRFDESELELTFKWPNQVSVNVSADLSHLFTYQHPNRIDSNNAFEFGEFIEEVWLEIERPAHAPLTIEMGKQEIVFGLHDINDVMAIAHSGPTSEFWRLFQSSEEGTLGITVTLLNDFSLGLFPDKLAVSAFEESGEEFELGDDFVAWQIRAEKQFQDLMLVAAYGVKSFEPLSELDEVSGEPSDGRKYVVGAKGAIAPETIAWVEVMRIEEHRDVDFLQPRDMWGVAAGISVDVLGGALNLVGSIEYLDSFTTNGVVGARLPLNRLIPLPVDASLAIQASHAVYDDIVAEGVVWEPDTSYVAELVVRY